MRKIAQARQASTLVEMGLLISLLMMVTLGILELGRAWFDFNLVTQAVRVAARQATVQPALQVNDARILQHIDATLQDGGLVATQRSVGFALPLKTGDRVHVSAEVAFRPFVSLIFSQGFTGIPLRAAVDARYEL